MRTETRTSKGFDAFHNASPCAFMGRAEVLPLFISTNSDLLDGPAVGVSHTCPHNSPAVPVGKREERSNMTRKMEESRMGVQPAEYLLCAFKYVCLHVCVPPLASEDICPALARVPMEHFP